MTEIMRLTVIDVTRHDGSGFQFEALGGEADFGKAQEDQAEDRREVFLGFEAGVGAPVVFRCAKVPPSGFAFRSRARARRGVGGIPEAFSSTALPLSFSEGAIQFIRRYPG
jgi:hypothetical protein